MKKYDGRTSAASWPSIALAATAPWRRALAQCSTRMCRPRRGLYAWAMSPAAKMSGSEVRRCSSTTIPLSILRPASAASSVGDGADANDDHVGVDSSPVAEHDTGRLSVPAGQFGRRGPVAQVHTVAAVQLGKDGRNLRAEHML